MQTSLEGLISIGPTTPSTIPLRIPLNEPQTQVLQNLPLTAQNRVQDVGRWFHLSPEKFFNQLNKPGTRSQLPGNVIIFQKLEEGWRNLIRTQGVSNTPQNRDAVFEYLENYYPGIREAFNSGRVEAEKLKSRPQPVRPHPSLTIRR